MRNTIIATAAALAVTVPAATQAQDIEVYAGFSVASEYVSQGLFLSDGVAVLPYLEVAYGGLYGGIYAINTDSSIVFSAQETGVYIGYRGQAGRLAYDAAYYQYLYDLASLDYSEVIVSAEYAVTDAIYVTGQVGYADFYDQTDLSIRGDYYIGGTDFSVSATYGDVQSNFGDWNYWSIGGSYAVSEQATFDVSYHETNADPALGLSNTDGMIVALISFDFTLR